MNQLINHPVILECIERGLTLVIKKDEITLDGFYKSGDIKLKLNSALNLVAYSRYAKSNIIQKFEDLVELNHYWWIYSRNRYAGWVNPDENWAEFMVEFGYVEKHIQHVEEYINLK